MLWRGRRLYIVPLFSGRCKRSDAILLILLFPRVLRRQPEKTASRSRTPFLSLSPFPFFPFFSARKFADDLIRLITLH